MTISVSRILPVFTTIATLALVDPASARAQANCNAIATAAIVDDADQWVPEQALLPNHDPTPAPDVKTIQLEDVIAAGAGQPREASRPRSNVDLSRLDRQGDRLLPNGYVLPVTAVANGSKSHGISKRLE